MGINFDKLNNKDTHLTLAEFYYELENHDWFYMMSDDQRVYDTGRRAEGILYSKAKILGPEYEELLMDYHEYKSSTARQNPIEKPLAPKGYSDLIFKKHAAAPF